MEITKRDGRLEAFDPRKIERAIQKSLDSTGKDYPEGLAASLAGKIASELDISVNTVNNHIANIFAKTEVRSRIDLLNLLQEASW